MSLVSAEGASHTAAAPHMPGRTVWRLPVLSVADVDLTAAGFVGNPDGDINS